MSIQVGSISDWDKVVDFLKPHIKSQTVFLLNGDLGAGKTTLVSRIAQDFKLPLASSPTFALIQNYKNEQIEIIHVDLYRLESSAEIDATGFWDLFENKKAVFFVEWPSKIAKDHWPLDWQIIEIFIKKINDHERRVDVVFNQC